MTKDVRASLERLIAALETHFAAAQAKRGDFDAAVETAYSRLADAFDEYDEALFERYDETTPLALYDDDEYDFVDEAEDQDTKAGLGANEDDFDFGDEDDDDEDDSDGSRRAPQFDSEVDPVQDSWIEIADTEPSAAG